MITKPRNAPFTLDLKRSGATEKFDVEIEDYFTVVVEPGNGRFLELEAPSDEGEYKISWKIGNHTFNETLKVTRTLYIKLNNTQPKISEPNKVLEQFGK